MDTTPCGMVDSEICPTRHFNGIPILADNTSVPYSEQSQRTLDRTCATGTVNSAGFASMLYFAYGSNMCTERLRVRKILSATPICVAHVSNYSFRFHKRSKDQSGKGDAFFTGSPEDRVWGVVFDINPSEESRLDVAEGLGHGYCKDEVMVTDRDGNRHRAFMYIAEETHIVPTLQPYSWYKRFVVEGARQHGLPADYIARIETLPATDDPDRNRDAENRTVPCSP